MTEQQGWRTYFRRALGSPIVVFALGTALVVMLLVPFFARANAS